MSPEERGILVQGSGVAGAHAFVHALEVRARQQLLDAPLAPAPTPPPNFAAWWCGEEPVGLVSPTRMAWLARHLRSGSYQAKGWVWHTANMSRAQRNAELEAALEQARSEGLLTGWRNERFSFWHSHCVKPDPQIDALLDVERAGFRHLGMLSHAVHVNGFTPDGQLWVARRALSKATDPGMLDNMTAGGLTAGETIKSCLRRELAEEAGLRSLWGLSIQSAGHTRSTRLEPEGWHDEVLHVFNLTLAPGFVPHNTDGEVSEFCCLPAQEVLARVHGGEFTADATQSLLHGLRSAVRN